MMSTAGNVVPFLPAPARPPSGGSSRLLSVPGLSPQAIQGLEATFPGILTAEMRALLAETGGLTAPELGAIDFTGRWHPEEPIHVLRPALTLAIDDEGRRWIAETSHARGLPGPVWCVVPDPAVTLHVCDDLRGFLDALHGAAARGQFGRWLRALQRDARAIWAQREALADASYQSCRQDDGLRGWLAELPFDVHIYDLRSPWELRGWPYGLAGPEGRLYRCGRMPVFAVATAPTANRRRGHVPRDGVESDMAPPVVAHALAA